VLELEDLEDDAVDLDVISVLELVGGDRGSQPLPAPNLEVFGAEDKEAVRLALPGTPRGGLRRLPAAGSAVRAVRAGRRRVADLPRSA